MCYRNAGIRRYADCRSDARYNLIVNAVPPQQFRFFTHPAKNRRVSALKPHYRLALQRQINQQLINLLLLHGMAVRQFAHIDLFSAGFHLFQQPRTCEPVVDQHIRLLNTL
ncbi:hypothetical protein D3C79_920800 [compost metagenome]